MDKFYTLMLAFCISVLFNSTSDKMLYTIETGDREILGFLIFPI